MKQFFRKSTILSGWILFAASVLLATALTLIHWADGNDDHLQERFCFWLLPIIPGIIAFSVRPFLDWFARWDP